METYQTVSEALNSLLAKGYKEDFNSMKKNEWAGKDGGLDPHHFKIDETHRFEGETDPGDEMVLYAISSVTHKLKGFLINAYGMYADQHAFNLMARLSATCTI